MKNHRTFYIHESICYVFLLIGLIACTQHSSVKNQILIDTTDSRSFAKKRTNLRSKKLKTLVTHEIYTDIGPGFEHFILMQGFSGAHLDSSIMVDLAVKYRDTASLPTNVLRFYSSDKDFVLNETSHNTKKINRSCIVAMIFGPRYKPSTYIFYDVKGNVIYQGAQWKK